jgi:hypothetical protein
MKFSNSADVYSKGTKEAILLQTGHDLIDEGIFIILNIFRLKVAQAIYISCTND